MERWNKYNPPFALERIARAFHNMNCIYKKKKADRSMGSNSGPEHARNVWGSLDK